MLSACIKHMLITYSTYVCTFYSLFSGILNSSAGKGLGGLGGLGGFSRGEEEPHEEADDITEEQQPQNYNYNSNNSGNNGNTSNNGNNSNVPSRFSQEDRRMLINKLIEKKKRSEEEADNIPYTEEQDNYENYNDEYQGDDENKWENNPMRSNNGNDNGNSNGNNNGDDELRYSYGGDREEKGTHC